MSTYVRFICLVNRDKKDFSNKPFLNSERVTHDQQPGYFLKAGKEKGPKKQGWVFIPVKKSDHNF